MDCFYNRARIAGDLNLKLPKTFFLAIQGAKRKRNFLLAGVRVRIVSLVHLRALAAFLVVAAHSVDASQRAGAWFGSEWLSLGNFGAIGVDIFFVISGFVMPLSLVGKSGLRDSSTFLIRRWFRIAPTYFLVSLVIIVIQDEKAFVPFPPFPGEPAAVTDVPTCPAPPPPPPE